MTVISGLLRLANNLYGFNIPIRKIPFIFSDLTAGALLLTVGVLVIITHLLQRLEKLKKVSIVLLACIWAYLGIGYFFYSLFIDFNITWVIIWSIVILAQHVMLRGEY